MQTPPPIEAFDEVPETLDPLDGLLRQIVSGFFLLTDGQGAVSKWSEPAELLFGREAADILGRPLFDTLITEAPIAAQAWRSFLETGQPPVAPACVDVTAGHPDGHRFPLELVFVPVKLDEGFDFSLFLEDLGFELPINLMLQRMRQQHPVVVRALRSALEAHPQPWEGWRTAGTLVAFRPLAESPWVDDALAAREAAREAADAEVEDRIANPDPGIQGESLSELDDAAAVVARLLTAMERIETLERTASGLPLALEEVRREAEASRARADAAERVAQLTRADVERSLGGAGPTPEEAAERAELLARLGRLELGLARAGEREEGRDAERAREVEAGRAALAGALERIEGLRSHAERLRASVAEAAVERREVQESAAGDRERLDFLQREAEEARARLDALAAAPIEPAAPVVAGLERAQVEGLVADALQAAQAAWAQRLDALAATTAAEVAEARRIAGDAHGRIDEVDRGAGGVLADVRAVREQLDGVAHAAHAAHDDVAVLRAEGEELRTGVVRLGGELEGLHAATAGARDDLHGRLAALASETHALREAASGGEAGLAALGDELRHALATAQAGTREELAGLRAQVEAGVAGARAELEAMRRQAETLALEVAAARREAEEARERSQAGDARFRRLRDELAEATAGLQALRGELASAGESASLARREAEEARRAAVQGSERSREGVNEVFREILGMAARGGAGGGRGRDEVAALNRAREAARAKATAAPPARAPREGFDDALRPMAVLGLDGRFRELNPAFAKLVGYQEHEFGKAVWPSVHDRQVYAQQVEQLGRLAAGELESVPVQSTFMHGQGLMVPIAGELRVVRGDDGAPAHLLLAGE